jgi:hypothetical protein
MPTPTLHSRLNDLASEFTDAILDAIRAASLDELQGLEPGGTTAGRPRMAKPGRLARRSAEDIAKALDMVVGLVKKTKNGLRAEDIRLALGLDVREMARVLKEGIAKKRLEATGQKRATTYLAS